MEENKHSIVHKLDKEIISEYIRLRKLARRYWNFGAFSFSYCLSYAILQFFTEGRVKNRWMILSSSVSALLVFRFYERNFVRMFNPDDYADLKTFCYKYGIQDSYI